MAQIFTKEILISMMLLFALFVNLNEAVEIRTYNALATGKTLQVHCKSKNDDLGVHQVVPGEFYMFSFTPSFFLTTLFFCGFVFDDTLHWYDIYVGGRDRNRCVDHCWWKIIESGPCLVGAGPGGSMLCYDWH